MTIFNTTQIRKKNIPTQSKGGKIVQAYLTYDDLQNCFVFPTSPQPGLFLSCPSPLPKPAKQVLRDEGSTCGLFLHADGHPLSFPLAVLPFAIGKKKAHDPEPTRHAVERDFQNLCWGAGAVLETWPLFTAARSSAALSPQSRSEWNARRRQRLHRMLS